jgi:hypothetical protein
MATKSYSFRADEELQAQMERLARVEGRSLSDLVRSCVRSYLGYPPHLRLRRQLEVLLFEILLASAYGHILAEEHLGADTVADNLPDIERRAWQRVRDVFNHLEEEEPG